MPSTDPTWQHYRGRVAALTRSRPDDDPELVEARRRLAELRLADNVQKLVDAAPPLTDAQRERIISILYAPRTRQRTAAKSGGAA